jgi:lysophospholipase L1-like esterase
MPLRNLSRLTVKLTLLATVITLGLTSLTAADASIGEPKYGNARFFRYHADFLERGAKGPVGVLFIGDSITAGWAAKSEIWDKAWGDYQPANFGIGGDQTQHVIWRIEQGELDKVNPKVVVLMIGTNNLGGHTAPDIAAANGKIVSMIHAKLPETKVLLLGVFPRGPRTNRGGIPDPHEEKMRMIGEINQELAAMDNGSNIRYLDLGPKFMSADGTIAKAIMPDQLHPSAAGYEIWVEGMKPLLDAMMASK